MQNRTARDVQVEEKHADQLSANVFRIIAIGFVAFVAICIPVILHP